MSLILQINSQLNEFVWGLPMPIAIVGSLDIQDVAVANLVYKRAIKKKIGSGIDISR